MITRATVLSRFNAIRANVLGGAEVTCTYHDESFTGLRNGLQLDQVTQIYGGLDDYQFSIYFDGSDLADRIKDNEQIVISSGPDFGGETLTMRVLGKYIDPMGAVHRLDIKELHA